MERVRRHDQADGLDVPSHSDAQFGILRRRSSEMGQKCTGRPVRSARADLVKARMRSGSVSSCSKWQPSRDGGSGRLTLLGSSKSASSGVAAIRSNATCLVLRIEAMSLPSLRVLGERLAAMSPVGFHVHQVREFPHARAAALEQSPWTCGSIVRPASGRNASSSRSTRLLARTVGFSRLIALAGRASAR
jgi:hypothetical protein